MDSIKISVLNDFGEFPAGRFHPADGEYTGERFRNELLVPNLQKYKKVIVVLDNDEGYGSSFLDEAFGGLVRANSINKDWLHEHLSIESSDENKTYIAEVWDDIDKAN